MRTIRDIANQTIRPAVMGKALTYPDGQTFDIIREIINTDKISQSDTARFAPHLQGGSVMETLSNVWHFLKQNIKYQLDPFGIQYIKTPARTWKDGFADCKSFSIFVASLLKNLGIPFNYRFVAFHQGGEFTHVYVVVPDNGKDIIMDVVMPSFNLEKPFVHKKDFPMTQIYRLSGIGQAPNTKIIDLGNKDISQITDGEMDLLIARDRLVTEKAIVEGLRGIGSVIAEKYQDSIDMIDDAIGAVNDYINGDSDDIDVDLALISRQATSGEYSSARQVAGIGALNLRKKFRAGKRVLLKKARNVIKRRLTPRQISGIWDIPELSGIGKTKGFLKKIAAKVKKGVKAVAKGVKKVAKGAAKVAKGVVKVAKKVVKAAVKVATLPLRLAAKGILEVTLPKAAPFFLYLFITDPKILAKAPANVQKKRKKAEKVANFIVNGIGMQRSHFMGIVRNGIMKHYGKSPEVVLAGMMKNIAGMGALPLVAITAIISIIKKIASLTKKKGEDVSANDAPDATDWGSLKESAKNALIKEIKLQPENTSALNTDSEDPEQPKAIEQMQPGDVTSTSLDDIPTQKAASGQNVTTASSYQSSPPASQQEEFNAGGKSIWNSLS